MMHPQLGVGLGHGHRLGGTLAALAVPSSETNAAFGALPAGFVHTRESIATRINHCGYTEEVGADVQRVQYNPALTLNGVPNPWGDGGSFPDNWRQIAGGLTATVVGRGVMPDGLPYVEFEVTGTSNGNAQVLGCLPGVPMAIPALPGDAVSGAIGLQVFSNAGVTLHRWISSYNSAGSIINANGLQGSEITPESGYVYEVRDNAVLSNASTAGACIGVRINIPAGSGTVVDARFRVVFPVLNMGAISAVTAAGGALPLTKRINGVPQYGLLGYLFEDSSTNLFLNSAVGATQDVTVTNEPHTLSFKGTGSIALSGASSDGPLVGTGSNARVFLTFTPAAGALTCTVTGDVREVQLEALPHGTSYIPTTAASATRDKDNIEMPADVWGDLATCSAAVRFMLVRNGGADTAPSKCPLNVTNGSGSDGLRVTSTGANVSLVLRSGNAAVASAAKLNVADTFTTGCIAWGGGSAIMAFDGAAPTVDLTAPSPAVAPTVFRLNGNQANQVGTAMILRFLRVWKGKKLSPAQVQSESARVA